MEELVRGQTPLAVCIDFDGTITETDVVDGIIQQFSIDSKWRTIEEAWDKGQIGSEECLRRQLEGVRISSESFTHYLKTIRLDPGYFDLHRLLKCKAIPLIVLSDGFDLFIREVFRLHSIYNVRFVSNCLRHSGDRLIPEFPHRSECARCGHCKRRTIRALKKHVGHVIFAGDGLSDACAAHEADTLFAKGKLKSHCEGEKIVHMPFQTLEDLTPVLSGLLDGIMEKVTEAVS